MRSRNIAALLTALLLAYPSPAPADDVPVLADPAQWLLNYGLAYGATVSHPTLADAEFVLAWMEAAGRVSPNLAEAHQWRYDLLTRLNRPAEALAAQRDYVLSAPRDLPAAFDLLQREIDNAQTIEARMTLCDEYLDRSDLPRELRSALLQRLAQMRYSQGDVEQARADAQAAVNLVPQNLPAQTLLAEIDDRLDEPATQVRLLCLELSVNPSSVGLRWRLADTLAALGMSEQAERFYAHACTAFAHARPQSPLPAVLLLAQANAQLDAGANEETIKTCRRILAADPANLDAAMLLIRAARNAGRLDLADAQAAALDAHLRELEPAGVATHNADLCHQIARFHLDVVSDPPRALQFALTADRDRPGDPAIRRTLGRAYLNTGDQTKAIELLTPLAADDQTTALTLARALRSQDRLSDAVNVLRQAEQLRHSGPAYNRIVAVLRELHESPATPPDRSAIADALAAFDDRVLDFQDQAGTLLAFDATWERSPLPFATPVHARLRLTNRAPYPVTLGANRMVNPQVAVSVVDTTRDGARLPNYLTVTLHDTLVLQPGAATTLTPRLDTFATWPILYYQPQRRAVTEFTFTLDPITSPGMAGTDQAATPDNQPTDNHLHNAQPGNDESAGVDSGDVGRPDVESADAESAGPLATGVETTDDEPAGLKLTNIEPADVESPQAAAIPDARTQETGSAPATRSALTGLQPVKQSLVRLPVDASVDGLRLIAQRLRSGTESERLTAITTLLALIYEHREYLQGVPHRYRATPVDTAKLTALIREALRDPSPIVRARAAGALAYLPLDEDTIAAAAPLIGDPHWLPRMLAVELFAKKQGPVFLPVLERMVSDPDPSVAHLAALYRDQLASRPSASRP